MQNNDDVIMLGLTMAMIVFFIAAIAAAFNHQKIAWWWDMFWAKRKFKRFVNAIPKGDLGLWHSVVADTPSGWELVATTTLSFDYVGREGRVYFKDKSGENKAMVRVELDPKYSLCTVRWTWTLPDSTELLAVSTENLKTFLGKGRRMKWRPETTAGGMQIIFLNFV